MNEPQSKDLLGDPTPQTPSMDAPLPWRVFQLNDYEWWLARTLEEAIAASMKESGCGPDEYEDAVEVSEEALDRLKFIEDPELPKKDWVQRTFREELRQRVEFKERLRLEHGIEPKAELFASTEY